MSNQTSWRREYYRRFRAAGYTALESIRSARVLSKWELLAEAGFVRLTAEPDESPDLSYLDDWTESRGDRASAKKARASIERDGVWGIVARYRVDVNENWWSIGDSVWGCAGYRDVTSPFENCYVTDVMDATMREFVNARRIHVRGLRIVKGLKFNVNRGFNV